MSALTTRTLTLLFVLWVLWLTYSLLVLQNIIFGVAPGFVAVVGYYAWRLLLAFEELADGVSRLADARTTESVDDES